MKSNGHMEYFEREDLEKSDSKAALEKTTRKAEV
jgi:hypothetical protein